MKKANALNMHTHHNDQKKNKKMLQTTTVFMYRKHEQKVEYIFTLYKNAVKLNGA